MQVYVCFPVLRSWRGGIILPVPHVYVAECFDTRRGVFVICVTAITCFKSLCSDIQHKTSLCPDI
jgi:hypothetical protein